MSYPIEYVSYSSLSLFHSCKWCWYHKYIKKLPSKKSKAALLGSKYHEEVHKYHTGQKYDKKLIKLYTDKYAPDYRRYSEIVFKMPLKFDGYVSPIPFYGFIDGINDNGICDLKCSGYKPESKENIQSMLYSLIYAQTRKRTPLFTFNWVNVEKKKVKNVAVMHNYDDFKWLLETKIKPFFEEVQHPEQLVLDGLPFAFHVYEDCPFN